MAFPKGLSALVADRGESQVAQVKQLATELRQRFPELAERHAAKLDSLAAAMIAAEQERRATVANLSRTSVEERIARTELVRQLHKNRGALRALYPRNARRVASFFPPSHSRAAGEPEPEVDVDDAVAGQPAP
jgi:hypothetical protein